ncbi:ankyrin repeat domain-containing protein 6-like [Plakobranchus ocellatus]|uniref:Ankyrin repeat domain-containing protein 6-like n=1 Tax=Plakobranchus ocellatus TaxID=259542 RepID=A0AAV4DDD5_9GAST|nr:ankyrin repeat domain-containing protein 6-like [Plakobranchus ocellatus]
MSLFRLHQESWERNSILACDEQTDLALYDSILCNDIGQVRHLAQHSKRDLNDCFLVVRHRKHMFVNPTQLVSTCGHSLILKFFIESGCDVNHISIMLRRSPVHMAVLNNNMSCLQLLVTARANLDVRDVFGNSPCHYAAMLGLHDMLDMMIRIGTQVNSQDITAKTPLMKAVRNNKSEATLRLIRANANLNIADSNNEVALHFAARNGNIETVDALLSSGSLIDVQNLWGRSPLMEAVCYNNRNVVQRLLAAGCDLSRRESKSGQTALHIAFTKKYVRVVEELLRYILTSPTLTMHLLAFYDWDTHKYLMFLKEHTGIENTLFQLAAESQNYDTCLLLASVGYTDYSALYSLREQLNNPDISDTKRQYLLALLETMKFVTPLKHSCRNVIRRQIGFELAQRISSLPIPLGLKEYLALKAETPCASAAKNA